MNRKPPMQEVEVPRMVSVPTSLSTSPHTFLLRSSTSGTHSCTYFAPVTHSAKLAVPLEDMLRTENERVQLTIFTFMTKLTNDIFLYEPDQFSLFSSRKGAPDKGFV